MSGRPTDAYLGRDGRTGTGAASGVAPSGVIGPAPRMIDICLRTGNRQSMPYAYLVMVKIVGNAQLEMVFTEVTVTVSGRNLLPLYLHLLEHSVERIEESGTGFDDPKHATHIASITIVPRSAGS
jgi:hypothetical protein